MDNAAAWMLAGGAIAAVMAMIAWSGDRRRAARRQLDRVGFMPWTNLFFWSIMLAVLLLGAGAKAMLAGSS